MKSIIVLLFLLGIIVSGCIDNPIKQVPVVKVNITFVETNGKVFAENYTLTQGMVDYAGRPRNTRAESFPAIAARTMVVRNNTNASTEGNGPWEAVLFKGNGTYKFNIGYNENYYPNPGDLVHVSIMVVNATGKRVGYVVDNMIWNGSSQR